MRRSVATVSAVVLGLALITPGTATAGPTPAGDELSPADKASLAAGLGIAPKAPYGTKPRGPNPFLAQVADAAKVDYAGWANYLRVQAKAKAKTRAARAAVEPPPAVVVDEDEVPGTSGRNAVRVSGQRVAGFGTGAGQYRGIRVLGSLDNEVVATPVVPPNAEDDGAIPLAG